MKGTAWIAALAIFFAAGFTLGVWYGGRPDPGSSGVGARDGGAAGRANDAQLVDGDDADVDGRRATDRRRDRRREDGRDDDDRDERKERPRRADALVAFRDAIASNDHHAAERALEDLIHGVGRLADEDVTGLGALLSATEGDLVRQLARALVTAGGDAGLAQVMNFLSDGGQSLEKRRHALEGLSHLPPERAAVVRGELADFLEAGPPEELRHAAAHTLGRLYGPDGVDGLLGLLQDRPAIDAGPIFDAVGDVARSSDVDRLVGLLSDGWSGREATGLLRAIGRIASRSGQPELLVDFLRDPPPGASLQQIARAVSDSSHFLGTDVLADALRAVAGDPRAQEPIAHALSRSGDRAAIDVLLEAAADPEVGLDRRVLAHALGDFHGRDAVPAMLDLLRQSRDEEMLEPLARGLARNAGAETMRDLLDILESSDSAWQRRAIAHALEESDGTLVEAGELLDRLRAETDEEVASALGRALERLHPRELEGRAGEFFESAETPQERIAFARILARQSSDDAVHRVARQLEREPDEHARWEMARLLGRSGDQGIDRLATMLESASDEDRRHSLLWGLEAARRPGPERARQLFLQLAGSDPSASIRGQAAEILGRQADPQLIPALSELRDRETDAEVRERIAHAIERLAARR